MHEDIARRVREQLEGMLQAEVITAPAPEPVAIPEIQKRRINLDEC